MNGKMIASKPLYGALAKRKEDRRARLQAQFSQMRPIAMAPAPGGPRMPMYSPGGPGLGQHMFYGQAQPTFIPPQPGFGYQQQLVPGMRPGGGPMPNFFMPMVPPGQQGQRPGGRRGGMLGQQNQQQSVPLMQQQMVPRARMYRYPPGRNVGEVPMGSVPYDIGNGMQLREPGMAADSDRCFSFCTCKCISNRAKNILLSLLVMENVEVVLQQLHVYLVLTLVLTRIWILSLHLLFVFQWKRREQGKKLLQRRL